MASSPSSVFSLPATSTWSTDVANILHSIWLNLQTFSCCILNTFLQAWLRVKENGGDLHQFSLLPICPNPFNLFSISPSLPPILLFSFDFRQLVCMSFSMICSWFSNSFLFLSTYQLSGYQRDGSAENSTGWAGEETPTQSDGCLPLAPRRRSQCAKRDMIKMFK